MIKYLLINFLRKKGLELIKPGVTDRKSVNYRKLLSFFDINVIFDVGANIGQFALEIRKLGYLNKIISFEPLSSAYSQLLVKSKNDNLWIINNFALGDIEEVREINIADNSVSSSMLEMLPEHVIHESNSLYIGKEVVKVRTLDNILKEIFDEIDNESIFLKLDVQGFERNVIEGAKASLNKIKLIQLEMALLPLYKNELVLQDMVKYMDEHGFGLYNIFPGFNNFETGRLLQVDGIFVRKDLLK